MFGDYKVVHLLGSTCNNEKRFRDMESLLTRMGYIVLAPVCFEYQNYIKQKDMYDSMCFAKLCASDFCVLVTPERIGESTLTRLMQCRELNKPVYYVVNKTLIEYTDHITK